nr:hypothetical protein [Micromonospora sp. DSM 115978]
KLLGSAAYVGYRMGSVETHGDWNDIFRNHLAFKDGEFTPKLSSYEIRPQPPLMLVILSLTVILENIGRIMPDHDAAELVEVLLRDLLRRARQVDDLHEAFLVRRGQANE